MIREFVCSIVDHHPLNKDVTSILYTKSIVENIIGIVNLSENDATLHYTSN